jgi:hypothetical protein
MFALCRARKTHLDVKIPVADSNLASPCSGEVAKPLRSLLRTAHPRSDNNVLTVVFEVDDWHRVGHSGPTTRNRQQHTGNPPLPLPPRAHPCAGTTTHSTW